MPDKPFIETPLQQQSMNISGKFSFIGNNCNVSISFKTVITHVWK